MEAFTGHSFWSLEVDVIELQIRLKGWPIVKMSTHRKEPFLLICRKFQLAFVCEETLPFSCPESTANQLHGVTLRSSITRGRGEGKSTFYLLSAKCLEGGYMQEPCSLINSLSEVWALGLSSKTRCLVCMWVGGPLEAGTLNAK